MIQPALLQFPTKFGEIPVLVFPAAKFPRPHQKEDRAFPSLQSKSYSKSVRLFATFKSFRLESPLERILVKQSFSKI